MFPIKAKWIKQPVSHGGTPSEQDVMVLGFSLHCPNSDVGSAVRPVAIVMDLSDNCLRYAELRFIKLENVPCSYPIATVDTLQPTDAVLALQRSPEAVLRKSPDGSVKLSQG